MRAEGLPLETLIYSLPQVAITPYMDTYFIILETNVFCCLLCASYNWIAVVKEIPPVSPTTGNLFWGWTHQETKMLHQMVTKRSRVQWEGEHGKACCHVLSHLHRDCKLFKPATIETIQSPPPAAAASDLRWYGLAWLVLPASECQGALSWVYRHHGGLVYSEAKLEARGMKPGKVQEERTFCNGVWRWGGGQKKAVWNSVVSCPQGNSTPLSVIDQGLILCLLYFTMSFIHQGRRWVETMLFSEPFMSLWLKMGTSHTCTPCTRPCGRWCRSGLHTGSRNS